MDRVIDLSAMTGGGTVTVISGKDRGIEARAHFHVAELDANGAPIEVRVPQNVRAVTPSFVLGMFGPSISKAGSPDAFFSKFHFDAKPHVMHQIRRGVRFGLLRGSARDNA